MNAVAICVDNAETISFMTARHGLGVCYMKMNMK
jgi:hypothetical protein